jgi:hypothetical protein
VIDMVRTGAVELGLLASAGEPENTLDIALVSRRGILSPAAAEFVTAATSAADS